MLSVRLWMCEGEAELRHWRLYVQDMIDFSDNLLSYTAEIDQDAFVSDGRTYDATLRNIELIGEAATHVPDQVREVNPHIPWRVIIGTRNRVAHGYLGLDDDVIWSIIQDDIPELLPKLRQILDSIDRDRK